MKRRIDAHRSGELAAIAAAEKKRPLVHGEQEMRHRQRRRRLAGAAGGEIAEADHRHAGRLALRLNAPPRYRAINGGQGREHAAATFAPPEGGLAHHDARCSKRSCTRYGSSAARVRSSAPPSCRTVLAPASATAVRAAGLASQALSCTINAS